MIETFTTVPQSRQLTGRRRFHCIHGCCVGYKRGEIGCCTGWTRQADVGRIERSVFGFDDGDSIKVCIFVSFRPLFFLIRLINKFWCSSSVIL